MYVKLMHMYLFTLNLSSAAIIIPVLFSLFNHLLLISLQLSHTTQIQLGMLGYFSVTLVYSVT